MRVCCRCKKTKNCSSFPKDKYKKDGFSHRCKECENFRQRQARKNKPEIWQKQKLKNLKNQRKRKGIPLEAPLLRKINPKGSGYIKRGYRYFYLPKNPFVKRKDGIISEHCLVMSIHIGRKLTNKETVHHKNGNKLDNRIENLQLFSHSHAKGQNVEDKVKWAIEIINEYGHIFGVKIKDEQ